MASEAELNDRFAALRAALRARPELQLVVSPAFKGYPTKKLQEWQSLDNQQVADLADGAIDCALLSPSLITDQYAKNLFNTPVAMTDKWGATSYRYQLKEQYLPKTNDETKVRHRGEAARPLAKKNPTQDAEKIDKNASAMQRPYDPVRDAEIVAAAGRSGIDLASMPFTKFDPAQHDFPIMAGRKPGDYAMAVVRTKDGFSLVIREKEGDRGDMLRTMARFGLLPPANAKDASSEADIEIFSKNFSRSQLTVVSPLPEALATAIMRTYGLELAREDSLEKLIIKCRKNDNLFAPWRQEPEVLPLETEQAKVEAAPAVLDTTQFYQALDVYQVKMNGWRKGDGSLMYEMEMQEQPDPSRVASGRLDWQQNYPEAGKLRREIIAQLGVECKVVKSGMWPHRTITVQPFTVLPTSEAQQEAAKNGPTCCNANWNTSLFPCLTGI